MSSGSSTQIQVLTELVDSRSDPDQRVVIGLVSQPGSFSFPGQNRELPVARQLSDVSQSWLT